MSIFLSYKVVKEKEKHYQNLSDKVTNSLLLRTGLSGGGRGCYNDLRQKHIFVLAKKSSILCHSHLFLG